MCFFMRLLFLNGRRTRSFISHKNVNQKAPQDFLITKLNMMQIGIYVYENRLYRHYWLGQTNSSIRPLFYC